jgi:hypothetical protein
MATSSNSEDHKIDVLQSELEYRRTKQGSIFSWCSAILVAIVGSPIALRIAMTRTQKTLVSVAVAGITAFAFLWLDYNAERESVTAKALESATECDLGHKHDELLDVRSTLSWYVGYRAALILQALAALVVIWCWVQTASA